MRLRGFRDTLRWSFLFKTIYSNKVFFKINLVYQANCWYGVLANKEKRANLLRIFIKLALLLILFKSNIKD